MVDVFLTVDTEVWPFARNWPAVPLPGNRRLTRGEISNYLYGVTPAGEYGIRYQIERFNAFGLNATFFVEALSAEVLGLDELKKLVAVIEEGSQEVQLQIHTEWLGELPNGGLPRGFRQFLHQFPLDDQRRIVAQGLDNLRRSGARDIVALRAGNFGADLDTLRAAAANELLFDSSYNIAFLGTGCDLSALGPLLRPKRIEGITEVPVSFFSDYPSHVRNVQLCACSFAELKEALLWAWRDKWPSFCIVLHSFELLKHYDQPGDPVTPHPLHVARFESLCDFLASNSDKFRTTHFRDYVPPEETDVAPRLMPSNLGRTLHRFGEQALGRPVGQVHPALHPPFRARSVKSLPVRPAAEDPPRHEHETVTRSSAAAIPRY
jgi:hypothetical protein